MSSYKTSKEEFVSGLTGSSILHVNLISSVALATIALNAALHTRFVFWRGTSFITAWIVLVLPFLLSMTVFANSPGLFTSSLLTSVGLLVLKPPLENGIALPGSNSPKSPVEKAPIKSSIRPLASLTTYRAHMLLMTILAILAVDFPVFPRSLAKCETYGVSLMDIGVGSFVFSQGIVSAIPMLKDPRYLVAPVLPKLARIGFKMIPIIALGLVRVLLVKGTEYPEHESEYGRHWNFFITLAIVPIMEVALHRTFVYMPVASLGLGVAIVHQILLSHFGLRDYVLNAERNDLTSANKEGLVSLTGYLAVHLLGLSLGTIVLPPSPSYLRHSLRRVLGTEKDKEKAKNLSLSSPRQTGKILTEISAYSILWWTGTYVVKYFQEGVSRRMVNLSYILWIVAYNTSFIVGYMFIDVVFFSSGPKGEEPVGIPLLEAINKNGLAVFLLANVITGVVNLTIPTMYTSDFWAMIVLSCYAYGVCLFAWAFRRRRILPL